MRTRLLQCATVELRKAGKRRAIKILIKLQKVIQLYGGGDGLRIALVFVVEQLSKSP